MTPKQILDSFSETLMQDDRILSVQERALLTSLLQHARTAANDNQETDDAVRAVIASAVGETVAQRAFAVLGGSIVERILAGSTDTQAELPDISSAKKSRTPGKGPMRDSPVTPKQPQPPEPTALPPSPQPQPPQGNPPSPQPQPPQPKVPPSPQPQPPQWNPPSPQPQPPQPRRPITRDEPVTPKQPQPPQGSVERVVKAETMVGVQERPSHLPGRCVILDEFLAPQELEELISFTLEHENDFSTSEVVSPVAENGVVNYEYRRSRVLMHMGRYEHLILERIKAALPQVLDKLGMEEFAISGTEAQITASNDGDFFRCHNDNGSDRVASRHLTFVYFFHREPRQFEGGELRIHDARLANNDYVSEGSYQTIVPQQNQIVFFPCELLHEITSVNCPSGLFADGRFTFNGWLRR